MDDPSKVTSLKIHVVIEATRSLETEEDVTKLVHKVMANIINPDNTQKYRVRVSRCHLEILKSKDMKIDVVSGV